MTLRLIVDVNLSPEWIKLIAEAGYEAMHWSRIGDPSARDQEIMDYARAHGFAIFTNDLDFSSMLAHSQGRGPSVIQVRGPRVLPEQIGTDLVSSLRRFQADLEAGALVVVEPGRSRVRVLPL